MTEPRISTPTQHPLFDAAARNPLDTPDLLAQLVGALGNGVWDWDLLADKVDYCPRFMAMLGYDGHQEFATQFSFRSHLHPDDVAKTLPLIHQTLEGERPLFDATYRLRLASGSYRWFQGRGAVLRSTEGKALRFTGVLVDAQARVEAEQQRQQREQAQRLRLRQDALAEWSRCLSPGLLALQKQTPHAAWRSLPQLLKALAGKQVQHLEMLDLREQVPAWVEAIQPLAPAHVRWVVRVSPLMPLPVLLDRDNLHLVLDALCTNAWQAVAETGGEVQVNVTAEADGSGVEVIVRDNGMGISSEVSGRVFEPFFTTRPMGKGWGLGLSVARQLTKLFQGRLTLTSQPGEGSEVRLWLPMVQTPTAGGRLPKPHSTGTSAWGDLPEPASSGRQAGGAANQGIQGASVPVPRHVVYVDDYEAMVYLMSRMLTRRGHRVTAFERATDAIAHLRAHGNEVDLLVSDYNMPGLSGLDVVRQAAVLCPGLPAVLTSGHVTPSMEAEAQAEGVLKVLNRQDSVEEQVDAIVRLLGTLPARSGQAG